MGCNIQNFREAEIPVTLEFQIKREIMKAIQALWMYAGRCILGRCNG
jgi:hypothetical protein